MRGERLVALAVVLALVLGATTVEALLRDRGEPATQALAQAAPTATSIPTAAPTVGASARLHSPVAPTSTPRPVATPAPTSTPPPTATPIPGPAKTGSGQAPLVSAPSVVIVDERSGQVLYDRSAHQRRAPASTTKILTALVALERGSPQARVKVRFDASELIDSTLMGLQQGDEMTLEDLLYGLMLPSGNDAALAIAEHIGGSKPAFVKMMNDKVRELGLKDSQFKNPHGLDEDGHYSSAYDMVMIARYAMQRYPLFARLSAAKYWEVRGSRSWEIYNLNKLLHSYAGADGVKIGYTDNAKRTIVASATRDGHRVYVGLMGSNDLVADCTPLFNYVFDNYRWP